MASPCIDVCRHDEATGWCLGCDMTRRHRKRWKQDKAERPEIRAALPGPIAARAALGAPTGQAARKGKG